jgi:hypothetical protein
MKLGYMDLARNIITYKASTHGCHFAPHLKQRHDDELTINTEKFSHLKHCLRDDRAAPCRAGKIVSINYAFSRQMGCPALGIWVAFLKQPDALPGRAPQKIKINIFLNYF